MSSVAFMATVGETGHRVTLGVHEELGKFTVETVHGATYTDATGSQPRQFAYFVFPDQSDRVGGTDLDGENAGDGTPEWQDSMHDNPATHIIPRLSRLIDAARQQGFLVETYRAYLSSSHPQKSVDELADLRNREPWDSNSL